MEQNERKDAEKPGQLDQGNKRFTGEHSGNPAETTMAPASLLPTLLKRLEQHRSYLSASTSRDELLAALNSHEWHVRAAAVKALATFAIQPPLGLLAGALHDEHPLVRAAAARAWGNLGNTAPLDPLIAALADPAWQVREVAALTLGELAEKGQRIPAASLVKMLHDEDAMVREAAATALRQARLDGAVTGTSPTLPAHMGSEAGWQGHEQASLQFQNAPWKTFNGDIPMKETRRPFLSENISSQPTGRLAGQMGPVRAHRRERSHISRRRMLMGLGIGTAGVVALGTAASYLLFSGRLPKFVGNTTSPGRATPEPTVPAPTAMVSPYDQWVQTHGIMFGFDPQHTGFNPYESVLTTANVSGLTQMWYSNAMKGNVFSSPTVSGGLVYIGSLDGHLYAIDATTSSTRWTSDSPGTSTTSNASTPAIINGTVYICLQDHRLYAFDAQSGQFRWNSPAGHTVGSSPIVVNGVVYVTGNGRVYAFDANSGQLRWVSTSLGIDNSDFPPVAVANNVIYVSMSGSGANAGQIYAYDAANGHKLWVSDLVNGGTDINSAPTVANGLVYIGSGNGGLMAFSATNGHFHWSTPATAGSTGSSPAIANGVAYLAEDRVYAFDAATGQKRWTTNPLGAYNSNSPVVANGIVYVCSAGDNSVHALDVASGHTLWTSPPANNQVFTVPAVAEGVVFMASEDGALYAFSLSR